MTHSSNSWRSKKLRTFIFPLGNPPMLRINGDLVRIDFPALANDDLKAMVYEIAPEGKIKLFEETLDVDFGYEVPGRRALPCEFLPAEVRHLGRLPSDSSKVLTADELGLPPVLKKFPMLKKGLSWSPARPVPANRPRSRR